MTDDSHCPFTQHSPGRPIKWEADVTTARGSPWPPARGSPWPPLERDHRWVLHVPWGPPITNSRGVRWKTNRKTKSSENQHRMRVEQGSKKWVKSLSLETTEETLKASGARSGELFRWEWGPHTKSEQLVMRTCSDTCPGISSLPWTQLGSVRVFYFSLTSNCTSSSTSSVLAELLLLQRVCYPVTVS